MALLHIIYFTRGIGANKTVYNGNQCENETQNFLEYIVQTNPTEIINTT